MLLLTGGGDDGKVDSDTHVLFLSYDRLSDKINAKWTKLETPVEQLESEGTKEEEEDYNVNEDGIEQVYVGRKVGSYPARYKHGSAIQNDTLYLFGGTTQTKKGCELEPDMYFISNIGSLSRLHPPIMDSPVPAVCWRKIEDDKVILNTQEPPSPLIAKSLQSELSSDMNSLLKDSSPFSDFTLFIQDEATMQELSYPCHKGILIARNPILRTMLTSGMKESSSDSMTMNGVSKEVLEPFLSYLYSDTLNITYDDAISLLMVAEEYNSSNLVQLCEGFVSREICEENLGELAEISEMFPQLAYLRKAVNTKLINKFSSLTSHFMEEIILSLNSDIEMESEIADWLDELKGNTPNIHQEISDSQTFQELKKLAEDCQNIKLSLDSSSDSEEEDDSIGENTDTNYSKIYFARRKISQQRRHHESRISDTDDEIMIQSLLGDLRHFHRERYLDLMLMQPECKELSLLGVGMIRPFINRSALPPQSFPFIDMTYPFFFHECFENTPIFSHLSKPEKEFLEEHPAFNLQNEQEEEGKSD